MQTQSVQTKTVEDIIALSRILGEFGAIQRAVKLPNGAAETDSHHSFVLALVAFEFARQYAPELDATKIALYGLVHDLPEIITGDTSTLLATTEQLATKKRQDAAALHELRHSLATAPNIFALVEAYEEKQDQESLFVYWLDKMLTIPTHFFDGGANLRQLGIHSRADIAQWYERTLQKLQNQKGSPHVSAIKILELAYQKMHDELLEG